MKLSWYWHRLRRMSPAEMLHRSEVAAWQAVWSKSVFRPRCPAFAGTERRIALPKLPAGMMTATPATQALVENAERMLAGTFQVLGLTLSHIPSEPDWFRDPLTGRRAPDDLYCFRVPYRDEARVGNIKYVWELSRHQHLIQLAAAYWVTGDPRFAEYVATQLRSWWRMNPFLHGVHWTSGIEVGLRLLSWTWIRALLSGWPKHVALFEENPVFFEQLYYHQKFLSRFASTGSSANNHAIAEFAGLAASTSAFPWFAESERWERWAWASLAREAVRQTYADGLNREQASGYHVFVLDMLFAAHLSGDLTGKPIPEDIAVIIRRMADALAATLDAAGWPSRYGDDDEGRALVVDSHEIPPHAALLGAIGILCGRSDWWPDMGNASVLELLSSAVGQSRPLPSTIVTRPVLFPNSGQAFLRAGKGREEIWVRCDHGELGYLSIAAHGHADALAIELRVGGVELLADPGTYCYHGETAWRRYFKGTSGHNTLTAEGKDQARFAGPFLWLDHGAPPVLDRIELDETAPQAIWQAHHDAYGRPDAPLRHIRKVTLDRLGRTVEIEDWIEADKPRDISLSLHFGPDITVETDGTVTQLSWNAEGGPRAAALTLPSELFWRLHYGGENPPLGWYSAGFGRRQPASTLVGTGKLVPNQHLITRFSIP